MLTDVSTSYGIAAVMLVVALALKRGQNHLAWLVRFAELLADGRLADTARHLYVNLAEVGAWLWEQPPLKWIAPQNPATSRPSDGGPPRLERLVAEIAALRDRLVRDRLLALRTANLGPLAVDRLQAVGASGPTLRASERGWIDDLGRLLMRLDAAAADLRRAAE